MKSYLEMAENVLRRAEKERAEAYGRKRRALLLCLPLILTAVVGAVLLHYGGNRPSVEPEDPNGGITEQDTVTIPAIMPSAQAADMTGLVVYKGGVYRQTAVYTGEETDAVRQLVGTLLGRATGKLDEWSSQDEYSEELASTVSGEVHSVKGYSEDFRICLIPDGVLDNECRPLKMVQIMERLDGIELTGGADIFAERLRIPGRIASLRTQKFDDWNNGREEYATMEQTEEFDLFLEALCNGKPEYRRDTDPDFYKRGQKQAFICIELEDGLIVRLRLFEEGLVCYQPMAWCFIGIPAEVFDPVFEAASG